MQAHLHEVHRILLLRGKHLAEGLADGIVGIGMCGNEGALDLVVLHRKKKVQTGHLDQEPAGLAGEFSRRP